MIDNPTNTKPGEDSRKQGITKEQLAQLLTTKEGRRLLSLKSPSFFASYYMGLKCLKHQDNWINTAYKLFGKAKLTKSKEKLMVLAPRGHGKSVLSLILAVWRLCTDRDCTVLIVSATAGQAEKRLKAIREYLEDPKIIADWASDDLLPFRDASTSWLNNRIYLKREGKIIDPSLEAIGIGGAITGAHVDMIILDDVEDSITAASDAMRRRSREWFGGTLMPILNRGGLMLTIGTRKGSNDLYGDMLKDPTTIAIVDQAILEWPTSYTFEMERVGGRDVVKHIHIEGEEFAKVLWPEERPLRFLLTEMATVGKQMFFREMQNSPLAGDDAVFNPDWVDQAQQRGRGLVLGKGALQVMNGMLDYIVVGCDLALNLDGGKAKSSDSDYTVLIALAIMKNGDRLLLDISRFRGASPAELYMRVESFCRGLPEPPREIRVERNSFGALHVAGLRGRSDLPYREHQTTQRSKQEGLSRVATLLENGKYILPVGDSDSRGKVQPLVDELVGFPYHKHDDTVLALSIAEHAAMSSFQHTIFIGDKQISSDGSTGDYQNYAQEAESEVLDTLWSSLRDGWD